MKLISLLVALVIVGLLINNQMNQSSSRAAHELNQKDSNSTLPGVPSAPQEVKNFEKDINAFILDNPRLRMQEAEESLGR